MKQNKNFNLLFLTEEAQPVSSRSSSFTKFHPAKTHQNGTFLRKFIDSLIKYFLNFQFNMSSRIIT
jgi:hypothetical protein